MRSLLTISCETFLQRLIMNDDALAERDVADDVLTAERIAATSTCRKQIVDALDDDRVLAHADELA